MKKIILSILFILPFIVNSCTEEPNELDKYQGVWDASLVLTTSVDGGEEIRTESTGQVEIISGDKVLYIDQYPYRVSGDKISIPKTTGRTNLNGMTMETTFEANGTLSDKEIKLQEINDVRSDYEGTITTTHQVIYLVLSR